MDLALLRAFVAVHRAGSFTRAAALLGLSQPAVTSQIRILERQLGRPLFHRRARGVTPTAVGDELAHKAAPHLDALLRITEAEREAAGASRTLHVAGRPEFLGLRVLPALAPLVGQATPCAPPWRPAPERPWTGSPPVTTTSSSPPPIRAAGSSPSPPCATRSTSWSPRPTGPPSSTRGACARRAPPLSTASRSWRSTRACRSSPAAGPPSSTPPPAARSLAATVVAPDLRAVLECVGAGAGLAVLPRYLCREALGSGRIVALAEPSVPPLRTWFLVVRTGSLALAHLARAHDRLVDAAVHW